MAVWLLVLPGHKTRLCELTSEHSEVSEAEGDPPGGPLRGIPGTPSAGSALPSPSVTPLLRGRALPLAEGALLAPFSVYVAFSSSLPQGLCLCFSCLEGSSPQHSDLPLSSPTRLAPHALCLPALGLPGAGVSLSAGPPPPVRGSHLRSPGASWVPRGRVAERRSECLQRASDRHGVPSHAAEGS